MRLGDGPTGGQCTKIFSSTTSDAEPGADQGFDERAPRRARRSATPRRAPTGASSPTVDHSALSTAVFTEAPSEPHDLEDRAPGAASRAASDTVAKARVRMIALQPGRVLVFSRSPMTSA